MTSRQMKKILAIGAICIASAACSKKTKPDQEKVGEAANGANAPAVESQALNFNPQGSDTGTIPGLFTVNFPYDGAELTADAKDKLKQDAEWMKKNPTLDIQIEGHCDERGSVEYNLALGERRAKTVKTYISDLGISGNRLRTVSYGKEKKIALGDTDADHAKNRRANFVPLPK